MWYGQGTRFMMVLIQGSHSTDPGQNPHHQRLFSGESPTEPTKATSVLSCPVFLCRHMHPPQGGARNPCTPKVLVVVCAWPEPHACFYPRPVTFWSGLFGRREMGVTGPVKKRRQLSGVGSTTRNRGEAHVSTRDRLPLSRRCFSVTPGIPRQGELSTPFAVMHASLTGQPSFPFR
jgi:hypothetical protein